MAIYLNGYELEELERRAASYELETMGRAVATLQNLREWTDSHSDGWAYWVKPRNAAQNLMGLLQGVDAFNPRDLEDEDYRRALRPIKAFLTRQGVDHGEIIRG